MDQHVTQQLDLKFNDQIQKMTIRFSEKIDVMIKKIDRE